MYKLYGFYDGDKHPVAKFTTKQKAEYYVDSVSLERFASGRRFRRDSLLGSYQNYSIECDDHIETDPEPPSKPPRKEYLGIITENGRGIIFNFGTDRKSAEAEAKKYGILGYLEEREI